MRQATRFSLVNGHRGFVDARPDVQAAIDNSIYFVKVALHEPTDGSSALKLGNWREILTEEEVANGVRPVQSVNNHDNGLFIKDLVPPADCTSNIRLAKINFAHWPIIVLANFCGKLDLHLFYYTYNIRTKTENNFFQNSILNQNFQRLFHMLVTHFWKRIVKNWSMNDCPISSQPLSIIIISKNGTNGPLLKVDATECPLVSVPVLAKR